MSTIIAESNICVDMQRSRGNKRPRQESSQSFLDQANAIMPGTTFCHLLQQAYDLVTVDKGIELDHIESFDAVDCFTMQHFERQTIQFEILTVRNLINQNIRAWQTDMSLVCRAGLFNMATMRHYFSRVPSVCQPFRLLVSETQLTKEQVKTVADPQVQTIMANTFDFISGKWFNFPFQWTVGSKYGYHMDDYAYKHGQQLALKPMKKRDVLDVIVELAKMKLEERDLCLQKDPLLLRYFLDDRTALKCLLKNRNEIEQQILFLHQLLIFSQLAQIIGSQETHFYKQLFPMMTRATYFLAVNDSKGIDPFSLSPQDLVKKIDHFTTDQVVYSSQKHFIYSFSSMQVTEETNTECSVLSE